MQVNGPFQLVYLPWIKDPWRGSLGVPFPAPLTGTTINVKLSQGLELFTVNLYSDEQSLQEIVKGFSALAVLVISMV